MNSTLLGRQQNCYERWYAEMAFVLPIVEDWFEIEPADEYGVSRIIERHVHGGDGGSIWLIEGRDKSLVIDTGIGAASLRRFVEISTSKPIVAFASVGYFDHAGGLHEFDERLIHSADAFRVKRPTRHNTVAAYYLGVGFTARPHPLFDQDSHVMPASEPTRLLSDGDTIDLGDRILEVLHVPGVTDGACALFERASGALFTGEACVWSDDAMYDGEPEERSNDANRTAFCASIKRLSELPATVVYPGHRGRSDAATMRSVIAAHLSSFDES